MVETINHKALAISRLATQFKSSTNLINYIRTIIDEHDVLETEMFEVINQRTLENANGKVLDIIGALVGQGREFVDAEIFDYFGFADHPQAQSFGSVNDNSVGGRFVEIGESITGFRYLSDDEYRSFIRARIAKNNTRSTPEDVIAQLSFIFNSPRIHFVDGQAFYEISIGRVLSANEKSLLFDTDIIPKTAGVAVGYVSEFDSSDFFAFGVPGGGGFGSVNNSALGSKFGNLI